MKRIVKLTKRPLAVDNRMKQIRSEVKKGIDSNLKRHVKLRRKATTKWSVRNKPQFPKFINFANTPRKKIKFGVMVVAPNARSASISVYRMNNDDRGSGKATKVRYAFMGKKYQAKTQPHRFGYFGKGGKPLFFVQHEGLEGIDAREWDEVANLALSSNLTDSLLSQEIIRGYRRGFRKVQGKTRNG